MVVNVPDNMKKWRYCTGTVIGIRGTDRTWSVMFIIEGGFSTRRKMMVFRRHELRKVSS